MLVTMVMHPMGGSIERLQRIAALIMTTHSLAILSVPFAILGFWGLTKKLEDSSLLALMAFSTMSVGLFAVVCAAAVNGLALPLFVTHYIDAPEEKLAAIKPVLNYNTALNHAFDLVYIGAACIAVFLWSLAIFRTHQLPAWLGWLGILLGLTTLVSMSAGFIFFDLTGFRIFVSGFVIWILCAGIFLRKTPPVEGGVNS